MEGQNEFYLIKINKSNFLSKSDVASLNSSFFLDVYLN